MTRGAFSPIIYVVQGKGAPLLTSITKMSLLVAVLLVFCLVGTAQAAVLERGDDGKGVTQLQKDLTKAGYYSGPITGYFGIQTENSIRNLQKAAGIVVDGVFGPGTSKALTKKLTGIPAPEKPQTTAAAVPTPVPAPATNQVGAKDVVGYYCQYSTNDSLSHESLKSYGSGVINGVVAAVYHMDAAGNITGMDATAGMKTAKSIGATSYAMLQNTYRGRFSKDVGHKILSNPKVRKVAADNILKLLKEEGFAGVNIDFEGIGREDRDNYTAFVRELSGVLKPQGYLVTLSIPAKKKEDPTNSWSAPFDYWELGAVADKIMIMTYDEHWSSSVAGPIASVEWVEQCMKFATSAIPSEKILMGIAAYGYDWQVGSKRAKAVPSSTAIEMWRSPDTKPGWDEVSQVPFYKYVAKNIQRVVYFEDARSTGEKLEIVNKYKLGGIAIWRLGYEDPGIWTVIKNKFARYTVSK
jgi:spore germination protein